MASSILITKLFTTTLLVWDCDTDGYNLLEAETSIYTSFTDYQEFTLRNSSHIHKDIRSFHLCQFITTRKRSLGRLCFYTCLSLCSQGEGWIDPDPGGGWGSSWGCPGPHPRGVSRPTPGGVRPMSRGSRSRGSRSRGVYPSMHWGRPPQQTATAACSMHPTGMHSCLLNLFAVKIQQSISTSSMQTCTKIQTRWYPLGI